MRKLTGIILAHDEEEKVAAACSSLKGLVSELFIVCDTTCVFPVKTLRHSLNNDFAAQRNWAMTQAQNDWILFLDADEVLSPKAHSTIQTLPFKNTAYSLRRIDRFWGKEIKHGEARVYVTRLVNRTHGKFVRPVHETWSGTTEPLNDPLIHNAHDSLSEFLTSVNYYSTLHAQELYRTKASAAWYDITLRPIAKFLYSYILKQGFRDGIEGLIYSYMMSFHSYLSRAKLYDLYHV